MEISHSEIGASSCERWWNCAGSVNLVRKGREKDLVDDVTSIYASEGTVAHELAAMCLNKGDDAEEWIGEELEADEKVIPVTMHMAEAVQEYLDTVREDMKNINGYCSLAVEKRFNLCSVDENAYGTNDASILAPYDTLIVYDYKHGAGIVVEVTDNKQLLYYALGALQSWGDVDHIMIVIVQPRAEHADGAVRRAVYSIEELRAFERDLKKHILATKDPDAPLVTGWWCSKTFCPAILFCPAAQKEVQDSAIVDFTHNPVRHPDINSLSIEQLIAIKNKAPLINSFVASCIVQLQKFAEAGIEVYGHKLVMTRTHRTWKNRKHAWDILNKLYKEKMFEPKLLSPAMIEKIMKPDGRLKLFESLVKRPEGRPVLVLSSDKREEVKPTVFSDFNKTEEDL